MHCNACLDSYKKEPSYTYSQISELFFRSHKSLDCDKGKCPAKENRHLKRLQSTNAGSEGKSQGKLLKHIFNELRNKTSSELESFINMNSISNEVRYQISTFTFYNEPSGTMIPFKTFKTYTVNTTNRSSINSDVQDFTSADEEDENWSINEKSPKISVKPEHNSCVSKCRCVEHNNGVGDLNLNDKSNKDKDATNILTVKENLNGVKIEPCSEVIYEDKKDMNFFQKVCGIFRPKKSTCDAGLQSENEAAKKEPWIEALFENSNCKCSQTIIRVNKTKCNTLNHYKCNKCGKIDLDKFENRCPKLKMEENALMLLLKIEARNNFKQIKLIQKELKEQRKVIQFLNNKYNNLVNLISPDNNTTSEQHKHQTYNVSTSDILSVKDEEVDAASEIPFEVLSSPSKTDSCTCPSKKPSFFAKIFKKKRCDTGCKCCIVPRPDVKECKFYGKKKRIKEKKEEEQTIETEKQEIIN